MTIEQSSPNTVMAVVESGPAGDPSPSAFEALGAARGLATGLGCELTVAFVAEQGAPAASDAARGCADRAFQVGWPEGAASAEDAIVEAAWVAIQTEAPNAILFPDSLSARAVAARVAVRMNSELVVGCTLLKVRDGKVEMGRAILSGKGFAQLEWDRTRPVVITVAAGAFAIPPTRGNIGDVTWLKSPDSAPSRVKVIGEVAPTPDAMGITEADVLVAGGAGVGGAEGFDQLMELAQRLGGTVAASRVAVDRGWMPSSRQVGLTGRSVSPRLYLAVGISGAPQHIAGIRSAGKVVAINQDPRAPIFRVADLAVVGDLHEVIPGLLARLQTLDGPTSSEGMEL